MQATELKPYPLQRNPETVKMDDKTAALPISEDISQKITSLAAGESHTIALTGKAKEPQLHFS